MSTSEKKFSFNQYLLKSFRKIRGLIRQYFYSREEETDFDRDLQLMSSKRNRLALFMSAMLLILITTFLVIIGWQREYLDAYLATKKDVKAFDNNRQTWVVSSVLQSSCTEWELCLKSLQDAPKRIIPYSDLTQPWREIDKGISDSEPVLISIQTTIDRAAWRSFFDFGYKRYFVGMPTGWYEQARAYVNGEYVGKYLKNNRIGIPVVLEQDPGDIRIQVIYLKKWNYSGLFEPEGEPLLLTTPGEYNAWVRMLVMRSASRGNWVADLAFIVLAVFFLLLYLFVDSSPEVGGLALFVSLDAFSRSLGYGWLPVPYTDQLGDMSDSASQVMRLYFLLQLGRLGSTKIGPWLIFAFIYSIFASAGSWVNALGWPVIEDRVYEINVWFGLGVALIGIGISVPTAINLKNKRLPWRQWALVIAALACFLQVAAYLNHIVPSLAGYTMFFQVRSIILPLSVYLLASSAFVNISTLENRVRMLSTAKAKNEMIEKELQLGRLVQNAYMKIPNLPADIDMSCHFEAAFYVSGDAYFVHWDPETKRLAVILGDMTGHGVHAALKATTLQVIARTIFRDPMRRSGDLGSRFMVYEQTLRSFLRESWGDGDLPTFLGVELDIITGRAVAHRANFPFPILIVQDEMGHWDVKVWADHTESLDSKSMGKKVFVVSATDGIISSSKNLHRFTKKLKLKLNESIDVDSSRIKEFLLTLTAESEPQILDDRTMVVFGLNSPKTAA